MGRSNSAYLMTRSTAEDNLSDYLKDVSPNELKTMEFDILNIFDRLNGGRRRSNSQSLRLSEISIPKLDFRDAEEDNEED